MDPALQKALDRLEAHFRQDARCLGMYLWGSAGAGTADAHSDLDVAFVLREEDLAAVDRGLRPICEQLCGRIVGWMSEGASDGFASYAFLFESDERPLLLCDVQLTTPRALSRRRVRPGRILFDHAGVLGAARERAADAPFTTADLQAAVQGYWIYMYLNGKYFRRGDLYKLLYVQEVLVRNHLEVLNALEPESRWSWWARDIQRLPEAKQRELLVYFDAVDFERIAAALRREAELFARDAVLACRWHGIEYPNLLELAVRRHLEQFGVFRAAIDNDATR
jgi:hypothetical protein